MNRREFIKSTALITADLAMPALFQKFIKEADCAEKIDLAVAHGASASKIARAAIDALGGMKRFISKGDVVVVKPNMAWDRTLNMQPIQILRLCQRLLRCVMRLVLKLLRFLIGQLMIQEGATSKVVLLRQQD